LFEGKDYFTIYDFMKAYEHFNGPEWDGEPIEPTPREAKISRSEPGPTPPGDPTIPDGPEKKPKKIKIKLASGAIQSMMGTVSQFQQTI
jgi:type I restriction enzyme R subunit